MDMQQSEPKGPEEEKHLREQLKEHLCTDKDEAVDREETRDTSPDQIMPHCVSVCECVREAEGSAAGMLMVGVSLSDISYLCKK